MNRPKPPPAETGVLLDRGPRDWQVVQQGARGTADLPLSGRWLTSASHRRARVIVRLVSQSDSEPASRLLDWREAATRADGTWSLTLRGVPRGGPYRLETALRLDDGPSEWAQRGDMVHHLGVGDVWLVAGQSNATGYGREPVNDPPEPGVHMFHLSGEWRLATHPLADSTRTRYPLNREGANASHSFAIPFAKKLRRALGWPIGLVPASLGGSSLSRWVRGVRGDLFTNMLAMLRDSGGGCRGLLWHQGCSDAVNGEHPAYLDRFARMIADLRRSLRSPRLPVITAQLNRYINLPDDSSAHEGFESVREQQRRAAREIPGVFVVATADLGLSDGIHNSAFANLVIGARMADVALGGVHGRKVKHRHPDLRRAWRAGPAALMLAFDHVEGRLVFENKRPGEDPFAVFDEKGAVPLAGWSLPRRNVFRLDFARPLAGHASVTACPGAYPPPFLPKDTAGHRPILAFTAHVKALHPHRKSP
jgi:hypothetical protein